MTTKSRSRKDKTQQQDRILEIVQAFKKNFKSVPQFPKKTSDDLLVKAQQALHLSVYI